MTKTWGIVLAVLILGTIAFGFFLKKDTKTGTDTYQLDGMALEAPQSPTANTENSSTTMNTTTMADQKNEHVRLVTSKGTIELELFSDKAPKTVENFLKLLKEGFYDETKFHRVIKDFMIQGGDPITKTDNAAAYGTGGPGYTFKDEINDVKLVRGTLAMANSGPDTNGSQFFIVTAEATPWLDGKHTVFGRVVSGMDVVSAIENTPTGVNDRPVEPVVVTSISALGVSK
jgi:cyclophilin family peptidyl-prolyl cis-trans isomerase